MRRFLADGSPLTTNEDDGERAILPLHAKAHAKHGSEQQINHLTRFMAHTIQITRAGDTPRKKETFCVWELVRKMKGRNYGRAATILNGGRSAQSMLHRPSPPERLASETGYASLHPAHHTRWARTPAESDFHKQLKSLIAVPPRLR